MPLVSIGLLSYNRPDDLVHAIESVINQSYRNLEIIISDNGSTDARCAEVIREYADRDERIITYIQEVNRGVHFNLKFVMEVATGDFFCWLAGDDAFSLNYVKDCVGLFAKNDTLVAAACMPAYLNSEQKLSFKYLPKTSGASGLKNKYALLLNHVFTDRNLFYYSIFKLSILKKCSKHFKKFYGSDLLLLLEVAKYGDLDIKEQAVGYLYQTHEGQISANSLQYRNRILAKNASFLEKHTFFTACIFQFIQIIFQDGRLSFGEKMILSFQILRLFIQTNRYHLIKYDIGIDGLVAKLKKKR